MAIAAILLLHVGLVLRHYPPSLLWRGEVPLHGDIYRYFATTYGVAQTGGLFGYDPFVMAGYPVGLWNSVGKKGFEIAHLLLPWLPLPALFYLVITVVPIVAPVALWLVLRPLLAAGRERLIGLPLILTYWHLGTHISYFWGFGNVFFPATACLVPAMVVLLWNVLQGQAVGRRGALLGLAAAAAVYLHPVVLAAAALAAIPVVLLNLHELRSRRAWGGLSLAAGVCALLTVWWLIPLFRTAGECAPMPKPFLQSSWKHLVMDFFSDRGYRHRFDRTFLFHVAVVFGAAGTVLSWRARRVLSVMGFAAAGCLALSYGGSYVPWMAALQPYRFLIPATVLLLGPAIVGVEWVLHTFQRAGRNGQVLGAILALAMLPQLTGYAIDAFWTRPVGGMCPKDRRMLEAVSRLPGRGRVMCDEASIAHLIPFCTGRAVIGGLSTQAFVKHGFAGMDNDGAFFGRAAAEWSGTALKTYLDAYAVEWAVLVRPEWLDLAARCPEIFEPAGAVDGYHIFRIAEAHPSLVLEGDAEVAPAYRGIDVRNVRTRALVLKLHYARWLSANNGVALEPAPVLDDPVPFIRAVVPDGVVSFTITVQ